jgi:hypothetical protein
LRCLKKRCQFLKNFSRVEDFRVLMALPRPYRVTIAYERLMKSGYYWATSLDAVHTSQIDCNYRFSEI